MMEEFEEIWMKIKENKAGIILGAYLLVSYGISMVWLQYQAVYLHRFSHDSFDYAVRLLAIGLFHVFLAFLTRLGIKKRRLFRERRT